MGYNIEWAKPEVTECWSYQGRLYRSEKTARYERDHAIKYYQNLIAKTPEHKNAEWWRDMIYGLEQRPVYKIAWNWEVVA